MGKPTVVVLSGIRWDFLWQRHQILATLFARAGYPTVYVETTGLATPSLLNKATVRKVLRRVLRARGKKVPAAEEAGLTVYSPLVAPPTARIFRHLNRRFFVRRVVRELRALAGGSPVVIAYPPTQTTLDILDGLKPRLTFYDCSENYEGFPGIPKDIRRTEAELLDRAGVVSCTSRFLLEKVAPRRPDAFLCGPGVDYDKFSVLQKGRPFGEVRTVCFFGHISEERIDFSILRALARAGIGVDLVGGLGRVDEGVLALPGVEHRGEVSHDKLPRLLAGADALIIPYRLNALTRGISPAKIYECLATGKPVVATPLPELEALSDHVYLAEGPEGFLEVLGRLPGAETEAKRRARIELARENSWEARFRAMEEAMWRKM